LGSLILTQPAIVINSVDLTSHIDQITIEQSYADIDVSTFGTTSKQHLAGLSDNKFTISFLQDFAVGSVDQTIFPLVGGTTSVSVKPTTNATSSTNPAYTFTVVVLDWKPIDATVGAVSKSAATWPITGNVTRATS
jgi:hypothetical protein